MISNFVTSMTVEECKEHYDGMLQQHTSRATRNFFIFIFCLVVAITAFFMDSMGVGAALLVVAIYFRLESISSEVSGNAVVAAYPIMLLLNRYGCQDNQFNKKISDNNS